VTPPDGLDSEMFNFPWQTRPDIRATERLLSGSCTSQEMPADLRAVADMLSALREPPSQREFTRWDEALAAYRGIIRQPVVVGEPATRPLPVGFVRVRPTRVRFRLAIASGVAMASLLGGGIAAAYTGSLPAGLQKFAHDTIAAPEVSTTTAAQHVGRKVGPPVAGHPAAGLCTAYLHAVQHGDAAERSVAFSKLATAAGGQAQVAAYCARYWHPTAGSHHGRHVGQGGTPAHAVGHHGKPLTGPGSGKGNGKGNGNGNSGGGGKQHGNGHGKPKRS